MAIVMLTAFTGSAALSAARARSQTVATPPAPFELDDFEFGGDFSLTDHAGHRFALHDVRGKVALVFFGYTTCPDVCPLTMSKIKTALQLLDAGTRQEVRTLFISVDAAHDTPRVLTDYVKSFGTTLIGLTGTKREIDRVAAQYRASYEITPAADSALGYRISHSVYTYLIDRNGRLRYVFRYGDSPEIIAAGLRAALHAQDVR